jgi:hypothetical protein
MKIFSKPIVLNAGEPSQVPSEQPIDVALTLAMADLKAHFIDTEKGVVRYNAIKGSAEFDRYKDLTRGLRSFDPRSLTEKEKRLAFWINIYNTAVIHGVIELALERSVKEFRDFFDRMTYEIGGFLFSLNDMEHGILRGNRRHPYGLLKPFQKKDSRLAFSVTPLDPRIHFALVCGARSCPPIGFYEAEQIDFQLDLAAGSFINSPQVTISPHEETVSISMIFKWYKIDFGGSDQAILGTLLNYLDEGEKRNFLKGKKDQLQINYLPYDWDLNTGESA